MSFRAMHGRRHVRASEKRWRRHETTRAAVGAQQDLVRFLELSKAHRLVVIQPKPGNLAPIHRPRALALERIAQLLVGIGPLQPLDLSPGTCQYEVRRRLGAISPPLLDFKRGDHGAMRVCAAFGMCGCCCAGQPVPPPRPSASACMRGRTRAGSARQRLRQATHLEDTGGISGRRLFAGPQARCRGGKRRWPSPAHALAPGLGLA